MKTYSMKAGDVQHAWILVDATGIPLGRLATFIATRLTGKYQPTYTPHIDAGDNVVVINAADVVVTGNKEQDKTYYSYSGYPGGLKSRSLADQRIKDATKIIDTAVKGMIPKNKLQAERMKRLRVFTGSEHGHAAQKPTLVKVKEDK